MSDADEFVESLANHLLADAIDTSRWPHALLKSCAQTSDAAWVKENLLNLSWEDAKDLFLGRYRDPLRLQRLQSTFYSLKKSAL